MNHTIQLYHDQQTHTVTLTLHYDNEPDAHVAYLNLLAMLVDQHHAAIVAEAPPTPLRRPDPPAPAW